MDMTLDNKNVLRQDDDLLQMLDRGIDDMEAIYDLTDIADYIERDFGKAALTYLKKTYGSR